jgi:hypothetical protein
LNRTPALRVIVVVGVLLTSGCATCQDASYFKPTAISGNAATGFPGIIHFKLSEGATMAIAIVGRDGYTVSHKHPLRFYADIKLDDGHTLRLSGSSLALSTDGGRRDVQIQYIHRMSPIPPHRFFTDSTGELRGGRHAVSFLDRLFDETAGWTTYHLVTDEVPDADFVAAFPKAFLNGMETVLPSISFMRVSERICTTPPLL